MNRETRMAILNAERKRRTISNKLVEQTRHEPQTRTVIIGDEQIKLNFVPHTSEQWTLGGIDDGHALPGFFQRLVDAARAGNDQAARSLSNVLDYCKYSPKSQAEFDAQIEFERKRFAQNGGVIAPVNRRAPGSKRSSPLNKDSTAATA